MWVTSTCSSASVTSGRGWRRSRRSARIRHREDAPRGGPDCGRRTAPSEQESVRHIAERHDGTGDFDIPLRLKIQHFTH